MSSTKFAFDSRTKKLHEPARLNVLLKLAESPSTFMEMVEDLEFTRGNLSSHIITLEELGYVQCQRIKVRPYSHENQTSIRLTPQGWKALADYYHACEGVTQLMKMALSLSSRC